MKAFLAVVGLGALLALSPAGLSLAADAGSAGGASVACESSDRCSVELPDSTGAPVTQPREVATAGKLLFFWGVGCSHCERAKSFVERVRHERPALEIESVEVRDDPVGRRRFFDMMAARGVAAPGIPAFVVGDSIEIGFVEGVTEQAVERLLDTSRIDGTSSGEPPRGVQTKLFGWVDASKLGLPLFTIALGLLDGFNPCAMWVLIFLLATLAGQGDRTRMTITAVTFVAVSGLMYFAFMAAWLSLFLAVGITRPIQIALGVMALAMGSVNLKDFFNFGRGPSLSIPDRAKPGIYARVRALLREHSLAASLAGVTVLAVLVNFVELLCTAGLPAVYTAVLAGSGLSAFGRLAYLALYNAAYILDDALMVTIAVVTLNRQRLSQAGGRWLKLVSGIVMIVLSALLIVRPDLLP